mgnify:CR=1 FL=1
MYHEWKVNARMNNTIFPRRGQIWIADLGSPSGSEQRGKRPVLVVQNDTGNEHSPVVIVSSITSGKKRFTTTHVFVKRILCGLRSDSTIMLEHLRTIDKSLLIRPVATLPPSIMREVNEKLKISLGL